MKFTRPDAVDDVAVVVEVIIASVSGVLVMHVTHGNIVNTTTTTDTWMTRIYPQNHFVVISIFSIL